MQISFDYFRCNPWYKPFGTDNVIRFVDFQKSKHFACKCLDKGGCLVDDKGKYMCIFRRLLQKLNLRENWTQPCHKYV